jgi:RNA polymerase sigma-70 factor, ECF subfamily
METPRLPEIGPTNLGRHEVTRPDLGGSAAGSVERAVCEALGTQRECLLAQVRRRGRGQVDAEEILQMALARALERAPQLRDPSRAEAWLGRVVRNVLVDELRKHPRSSCDVKELDLGTTHEEEGTACGCALVQAQQLKPEYASILRRVVLDGVSVTDLAAELGVTPNNAMVRLHRARQALRNRLRSHCGTTSARACGTCGCAERGCCEPARS